MAELGINTVRTYTPPRHDLLDEAARHGLRVMVGLPWSQHVAFLDDRALKRRIRRETVAQRPGDRPVIRPRPSWRSATKSRRASCAGTDACASSGSFASCTRTPRRRHPTPCSPTSTFRRPNSWISRSSISTRSTSTCTASRNCAPIWPGCSTSPATSRCCWPRPAPTRSAKARRVRPTITAMHIRAAFEEGACGAIAFAWTDEWWRGGYRRRRLGVRARRSPAPPEAGGAGGRRRVRGRAVLARGERAWPRVSVVVCAYNAADTLDDCLSSLER